jgi:hypothetical protein
MVDALTNGGSSAAEGVDAQHMRIVHAMSHMLMDEYTDRLLGDTRWCDAYAAAAVAVARASRAGRCARIMVFGLGSMVPALAAARAGAKVTVLERVLRFADCAAALAARNGLSDSVRVVRCKNWSELGGVELSKSKGGFDAVITEEVADDLLGDGLLTSARFARKALA